MTFKQVLAVCIVASFILGTILYWELKLAFAFIGLALSFASGILDIPNFVEFASLEIIEFLIGMMLFVGFFKKNKLFEYLIGKIVTLLSGNQVLFFSLLVLSAFLSAVVDEVTSILFMTGMIFCICSRIWIAPVPLLMLSILATNICSSATAVGNPVVVLIAIKGKLSFGDFCAGNAGNFAGSSRIPCFRLCFLPGLY